MPTKSKGSKQSDYFVRRLKALMNDHNFTQKKLSVITGNSRSAIAKWRRGVIPNAAQLFSISIATGASMESFFVGSNPGITGSPLLDLHFRVIEMQQKHFKDGTLQGTLKHLSNEIKELMDKPCDSSEWADALILLLAALWRAGLTPWDLIAFANQKMDINEKRQWPATPDADGVYHHIE